MHICRVCPVFQDELKYSEHYIAGELSSLGHSTTFVSTNRYLPEWTPYLRGTPTVGYSRAPNYDVHRLRSLMLCGKTVVPNVRAFYRRVFCQEHDLIHLSGLATPISITTLLRSSHYQRPIVVSDHTDDRSAKRGGLAATMYYLLMRGLLARLRCRIGAIITFNRESAHLIASRFGMHESLFRVIPLGYDARTFRPVARVSPPRKFVVGYAGKVAPEKRVEELLHGVASARFDQPVECRIAGMPNDSTEYSQRLRHLAKTLNMPVSFKHILPPEQLSEFYNEIDLAVYPGDISITTIEANGCGTPTVIFNSIDGLAHRVAKGRGELFDTKDELVTLLEHYSKRHAHGEIDRQAISDRTRQAYSWESLTKKYLDVYTAVCSEGKVAYA